MRETASFSTQIAGPVLELTPREHEILGLLPQGPSDAAIARTLGISPRTVSKHIEHILYKLHARSRTAAAVKWVEQKNTVAEGRE